MSANYLDNCPGMVHQTHAESANKFMSCGGDNTKCANEEICLGENLASAFTSPDVSFYIHTQIEISNPFIFLMSAVAIFYPWGKWVPSAHFLRRR